MTELKKNPSIDPLSGLLNRLSGLVLCLGLAAATSLPATAADINTGGVTGAYHSTFCPRLASQLKGQSGNYRCRPSAGTRENIERVYLNPRSIGYGQLDVIALETSEMKQSPFKLLRSDDEKECIFAVTKSREINNYGDIVGYAPELKFILPPRGSGSAGTFQFLQELDGNGLGQARKVTYANSTDDAIIRTLNSKGAVTFFVQFPDPGNARFKLIKKLGGQLVPVLDRKMLRQKLGGQKVYSAQETQVANASWSAAGNKVITSCTPLVVFTGASWRISGRTDRADHQELIDSVKSIPVKALQPRKGFFASLLQRTRALTEKGRERLLVLSEKARERARPVIGRVKERARDLGDAAARGAEILREKGRQKIERY